MSVRLMPGLKLISSSPGMMAGDSLGAAAEAALTLVASRGADAGRLRFIRARPASAAGADDNGSLNWKVGRVAEASKARAAALREELPSREPAAAPAGRAATEADRVPTASNTFTSSTCQPSKLL